jgi:hypothetical protein
MAITTTLEQARGIESPLVSGTVFGELGNG